jgi:hypothetical protein
MLHITGPIKGTATTICFELVVNFGDNLDAAWAGIPCRMMARGYSVLVRPTGRLRRYRGQGTGALAQPGGSARQPAAWESGGFLPPGRECWDGS